MTEQDILQHPIILLGGGLKYHPADDDVSSDGEVRRRGEVGLTERTFDRLWTIEPYAHKLAGDAFVLCSGGYSKMDGMGDVSETQKEGYQMADWLMRHGISYRRIEVDTSPESTVGNLVGAIGGGWIDPDQPLTVATHRWHLPRVQVVAYELGIRRLGHIDAGTEGASPYEHISLEAHQVVLRGVGGRALLADPRSFERAIGAHIERVRAAA